MTKKVMLQMSYLSCKLKWGWQLLVMLYKLNFQLYNIIIHTKKDALNVNQTSYGGGANVKTNC